MADRSFYYSDHNQIKEYYALPEGTRKELFRGRLYDMAAPNRNHQKIAGKLFQWIANYLDETDKDCEVYHAPFDVHIQKKDELHDYDSIVQPDISVVCDKKKLTEQGCEGAPDWIIEIVSPGNSQHDYYDKLFLYRDGGVREYWIVDPVCRRILVNYFEDEESPVTIYGFSDKIPVRISEATKMIFRNTRSIF